MDPSSKNWLPLCVDEHLAFAPATEAGVSPADVAYHFLHSSGLFYGTIKDSQLQHHKDCQSWSEADKFKVAIAEGLLRVCIARDHQAVKNDCIQKIYQFYLLFSVRDATQRKYRTIFSQDIKTIEAVEAIIDLRVGTPSLLQRNFWQGTQFNIFAGLDVLYFALWLQGDYSFDKRHEIKKDIAATLALASKANGNAESNARAIASYFVAAGNFSEKELQELPAHTADIDAFRNSYPKQLHRLLYDYASYCCFADNILTDRQILFLKGIANSLHLTEKETDASLDATESFLTQHGQSIFYLCYKEGIGRIHQAFYNRLQTFVTKNKQKILTEIMESKELVELINKARSERLTAEEKAKVQEQLLDLLKTIPSLAIFMIPGGAVILPIILKILPEKILMPSSFFNKKKDD